ncbi:unnamed protein product [Blumeria hordei]|uniref:DUF7719 domain-containing protein n=2 Tax=Blumeria hordei TaxID=2867405 RepID=A0A383UXQ7_BLUHO|nr:hypothetical protein BGHDH14_bgh02042 [Blumeria hordei DH14]SZF05133.1 unnamed protein product [Blumeria hordei]
MTTKTPTDQSSQTLLEIAEKRQLLRAEQDKETDVTVGRLPEAILWSISLTMLHLTMDLLVTHQYVEEIEWSSILLRATQAFPVILLLIYLFHPHPFPSHLTPTLPVKIQALSHQLFFFTCSMMAGSYFIHITNRYPFYAVMKQVPPLGCLWIWSVIELDILWATGSLVCSCIYLKLGNYSFW